MNRGNTEAASTSMTTFSMRARLLIAATIVVICFTALTGIALDRAFRTSVLELNLERMDARIYMLIGAAQLPVDGQLIMPATLPEPALSSPGSGTYASISDAQGRNLWISESSLGADIYYPPARQPGVAVNGESPSPGGGIALTRALPVIWERSSGPDKILVFQTAMDRAGIDAEVAGFRRTLLSWLGGAALLLLALQAAVLIWSLAPVRRVADEIRNIESGDQELLVKTYPRELRPLTDNLNAFITNRQSRMQRYRNALADLAHSLKTPLAVMRASAAEPGELRPSALLAQLDQMNETIEYQLQRAAASGRSPLAAAIDVTGAVERVTESLRKLYRDKAIRIDVLIAAGTRFHGDPGDLAELTGNLVDNACKWARSRVRVKAGNESGDQARPRLMLSVEDDGPGIDDEFKSKVLKRGIRVDSQMPGQGIGLAVVREMVEDIYDGEISIERSELGGARVYVRL